MISKSEKEAELVQKVIAAWQPHFTRPMQESDAEEIIARWIGFIRIVGETLSSQQ